MNTTNETIGAVALLVAIVCAVPGFLLNWPTNPRRLMWRVGCFAGMAGLACTGIVDAHGFWPKAFWYAVATTWWLNAMGAWRRAEKLRELVRTLDAADASEIHR